jgi:hypothetical protein
MILLLAALGGCASTSHSEGSRAELYASIEQLTADSTVVVVATATSEVETSKEPQVLTGTHVVVEQPLTPNGLPSDSPTLEVSETVTVWQLGDATSAGPLPLMREGDRYLLFLVATGLDNLPGYFITGSSAGYWRENGQGFARPVDEGDQLPQILTLGDLK